MRLAVLGSPISHSLSPVIHTAALEALGIEGTYEARDVDESGLDAAFTHLRDGTLDGANVTMPHKTAATARCDVLRGVAGRLGAVNTLSTDGTSVIGDNTDAPGIADAWERRGLPDAGPVLILGGGGAARAALLALGQRPMLVSTRRRGAGSAAADAVGVRAGAVPWGEPVDGAVVVNATPLGMLGESLPRGVVEAASGLFEMTYGAAPTPALQAAVSSGLPTVDGVDLLVAQAAHSFAIWTGREAPLAAMEAAARMAIA